LHEFVYDHVCFCVYVYLLALSSTYQRKHVAFVFLILANCPPIASIYFPTTCHSLFLRAEWNSIVYIYHIFLIHSRRYLGCKVPGLFP
jgi:hypothetical protein